MYLFGVVSTRVQRSIESQSAEHNVKISYYNNRIDKFMSTNASRRYSVDTNGADFVPHVPMHGSQNCILCLNCNTHTYFVKAKSWVLHVGMAVNTLLLKAKTSKNLTNKVEYHTGNIFHPVSSATDKAILLLNYTDKH